MSIHIIENDVCSVLLADGWHDVAPNSFSVDAYEIAGGDGNTDDFVLAGGQVAGVPSTGATWMEKIDGHWVRTSAPLTAILALRELDE